MPEFREKLVETAKRAVIAAPRCTNEESTKMFLVIPFISLLGYDHLNPNEVFPEHPASFAEKYKHRVDFAIIKNEKPIIAVECKSVGAALKDHRGQLRSYFNAEKTVKMGIITDGLIWEFYADSDEPNMMDEKAFLCIDLREIAKGKVEDSALDGLRSLHKNSFDPDNIGAEAKRKHVFNSVLAQISQLSQDADEAFCRMLLQGAGITHVRQKTVDEYKGVIQRAFREFIDQQILQRLDLNNRENDKALIPPPAGEPIILPQKIEEKITTTEKELSVFRWVQQRLAFLIKEDDLFNEISNIAYKDYQGKFVVFYKMERKGRLFEFIEPKGDKGQNYRFILPDDVPVSSKELVTEKLSALDSDLVAIFKNRVITMNKPSTLDPMG